ncbi:hypothetical protein [Staphylococcus aureus]|uniref:hypothetical protein n=1 Tax=Staphylococcus aureus TaxID=1280 RepID=UPI00210BEBB4|nr:hypothetical protein [Staphylococcus aureus]
MKEEGEGGEKKGKILYTWLLKNQEFSQNLDQIMLKKGVLNQTIFIGFLVCGAWGGVFVVWPPKQH